MRRDRAPGREARDIHDDRGGRRGGVDKKVLVLNSVDDVDPEYQYYNEKKQGGERKAFRA